MRTISIIFIILLAISAPFFLALDPEVNFDSVLTKYLPIISKESDIAYNVSSLEVSDFGKIKDQWLASSTINSFIEINFSQMMLRLFKQGKVFKEYPVLARGNEPIWGGTPVGAYKIGSKITQAFAFGEGLYMPYALQIYGKFWIHGVPYFPNGKKVFSRYSHGCVRLEDQNAKDLFKYVESGMPIVLIDRERDDFNYHQYLGSKSSRQGADLVEGTNRIAISGEQTLNAILPPKLSAENFLIVDLHNDNVLASKDADQEKSIASLVKLMTAVVVAENVDLRRSINVQKDILSRGYGVTQGLEIGKRFRVIELLNPLLIESSNDAGELLAEFLGRDKTIEMMNTKAKSMGMTKTSFVDPTGFEKDNISTAKDIYYLTRYIYFNLSPLFKISKSQETETFGSIDLTPKNYRNKNIFYKHPSFLGGKIGYLNESGKTASFIFEVISPRGEKRQIVLVLLNSKDLLLDTKKFFDWFKDIYGFTLKKSLDYF